MNTKLLRQKVLDLAIHGKLVPQNPEHEPASKLLERIRGESLPLALRVSERNSVVSDSERTTHSPRGKAPKTPSAPISEDEIPFEIPENWCWCRLGDVCSFIGGGTPDKSKREYWNGSINWASVKDIKGNELFSTEDYITELGVECSSVHIAEIDDIILVTRISPGKAILSKIRTAINQDLKIVVPRITINKKYLLYYFQFSESDFIENSSGTTVKGIKLDYIIGKFLPLPPLEEQKLIVEEIERIFALIDTVEQNKTDLETVIKQTKSKVLDLAIHGKLVPQDKADEPASKMLEKLRAEKEAKIAKGQLKLDKNDSYIYKSANGKWLERKADGSEEEIEVPFEIPESWSWCKIKNIALDMADGPFGSNLKTEHYTTEQEARLIQLSNIGEEGWREDNTKYTTFEHAKTYISRSIVEPGNIVIAKMMPAGRAIICPDHEKMFVLSSDAVRLVPSKLLCVDYLLKAINSPTFRESVTDNVQGSTRMRTSISKLKECLIPIPPVEEQKKIITKLKDTNNQIDKIIDSIK